MREHFESCEDRKNQAELAEGVQRLMGWGLRDLSKSNAHYSLDYLATKRGTRQAVAWVELKVRHHTFGEFPTIMLSAGKWRDGVTLAESTGLPFYLFFRFTDDVYYYRYDAVHLMSERTANVVTFEWGGRTVKERDEADAEPVALIPLQLWYRVVIPEVPAPEQHPF
jgi:hypothetical protein